MNIIHMITGGILLLSHGFFFFRGLYLLKNDLGPGKSDKTARQLAHLFIPITLITGAITFAGGGRLLFFHLLPVILLVLAIPLNFVIRKIILRSRKAPWLLPGLNLLFIIGAFVSGIIL